MESWIHYHHGISKASLVYAGADSDGTAIYVGRAHHCGDLVPGKFLTSTNQCHIPYNGQEIPVSSFEVLLMGSFIWVSSSDGHVPPNAVVGGRTINGETLYVGRAHHCGALTPGKVHPSHRKLYLAYGGSEHGHTRYEVLVRQVTHHHHCPPVVQTCPPVHITAFPPHGGHSYGHSHGHSHGYGHRRY